MFGRSRRTLCEKLFPIIRTLSSSAPQNAAARRKTAARENAFRFMQKLLVYRWISVQRRRRLRQETRLRLVVIRKNAASSPAGARKKTHVPKQRRRIAPSTAPEMKNAITP